MKQVKNLRNQKTFEALKSKADFFNKKSRMPSLKMVAKLLDELGVEYTLHEYSETKWGNNGLRYHTSGGGTYYGWKMRVPDANLCMNTVETYYSQNTSGYAYNLVKLLEGKF